MRDPGKWVCAVVFLSCGLAMAQAPVAKPVAPVGSIAGRPEWPVAKPADVASAEAIVAAVYDVISGPKGQERDWNRMRSLFVPDARLIPIRPADAAGHTDLTPLTIDGYIARASGRMTAQGFFERSVANRVEQYGSLVAVWSTYESRHDLGDAAPSGRPIPEKYLH